MNWHLAHTFSSFHPIYFHKLMCSMKCMVCAVIIIGVFGVIIYKYMYIFVCKCTSIFVNLLPSKFSPESPICMIRSFFLADRCNMKALLKLFDCLAVFRMLWIFSLFLTQTFRMMRSKVKVNLLMLRWI